MITSHTKHAKKLGISNNCSAHTSAIGGGCLNCGYGMKRDNQKLPTKEQKLARLKALGFEF